MKEIVCKVISAFRRLSDGCLIEPSDRPYVCSEETAERLSRKGCLQIIGPVEVAGVDLSASVCIPPAVESALSLANDLLCGDSNESPTVDAALKVAGEILQDGDPVPEEPEIREEFEAAPESPLQNRPLKRGRHKKRR